MLRLALVCGLVAGCVEGPSQQGTTTTTAPVLGDGTSDVADRNCNVVLRDLLRNQTGLGYETDGASWVWQGTIEVSEAAAAEGAVPSIMYRSGSSATWRQVAATASTEAATPGFARFTVRIAQDLPGPATQHPETIRIEAVPFLATTGGGRMFDHNRNAGDLDNYVMTSPDLAIWRNDAVCAPPAGPTRARLVFDADWTQHREGVLAPGGAVSIVYAQSRLDQCLDTQGGHALWDITAHVRFDPGGELVDASVRDGLATMSVPTDARRATVWFESTNVTGCHYWDSNYGNNYVFDAATPPQWVGNAQTLLTRDDSGDICGGGAASSGFAFDTWARQRATLTNLCFQVYQPGMTDVDDPLLWQKLDVSLHWREAGQPTWQVLPVNFDRRTGNNARYAQSWRELDPFRAYHCPSGTQTATPDGMYTQETVEYYIVVNGYELRPEPGAAFAGTFIDYPNDPWRSANCH